MILVDTSAWCALYDRSDSKHGAARSFWRKCASTRETLLSTFDVFDETVTLLLKRVGHTAALQFGEAFLVSQLLDRAEVTAEIREAAWKLFRRYDDHIFSFTDCTSFATMHARAVRRAFTFDADFRKAGFEVVP